MFVCAQGFLQILHFTISDSLIKYMNACFQIANNNNNYNNLDLARELKKLWNMKVTIVPIVIGALGTITKGLLKGLEDLEIGGRVETIQTTALLRTARILKRVLETCCHSISSVKPSVNADVKKEYIIKIIKILIEKLNFL